MQIVDLHCHCLPGLDDGPGDLSESIRLCRMLEADGVETVVATPHQLGSYRGRNRAADVRAGVEALQRELDAGKVALRVLPGGDVRVDEDWPELLARDEILTLGDKRRWLLLEMPGETCYDIAELLETLKSQGIGVIFTHPERYAWADRVLPQLLRRAESHGLLLQITAGSLLGGFGPQAEARAWRWLETGLVDVVASDAHDCVARPPRLKEAAAAITERLGGKVAERVLSIVPRRVLGLEDESAVDSDKRK